MLIAVVSHIGSESLGGTLPSEIGGLVYLQDLRIGSNGFGGTLPSEIGMWTQLTFLDICAWRSTMHCF